MKRLVSETILDALLAAMVLISVVLSARLWFPATPNPSGTSGGTSVQELPPASYAAMPVIHRPDRILVRRADGKTALLMTSSVSYDRMRNAVISAVDDLKEPTWVLDGTALPTGPTITLYLPFPLTLDELADEWAWTDLKGQGGSFKVDEITVSLVENGPVWLEGPTAGRYQLGPVPAKERQQMLATIQTLDEAEFRVYRPLKEAAGVKLRAPILVPDVTSVPDLTAVVVAPDRSAEETRFFPDLSVVRQIDEEGAVSLTDGQRLLRLSDNGILELNLAQASRETGTPTSQMEVIRRWVAENGGWPLDLVLSRTSTQNGRSLYQFELRLVGPYPVESHGGALQIQLTGNQVLTFRRYPTIAGMRPGRSDVTIRTAEEALELAASQAPTLLLMPLRDVYLSYQLQPGDTLRPWIVEPTWVFRAGELRVMVPARRDQKDLHVNLVR